MANDSADIDGIIGAIERIRQPSDLKSTEEDIIRAGCVACIFPTHDSKTN